MPTLASGKPAGSAGGFDYSKYTAGVGSGSGSSAGGFDFSKFMPGGAGGFDFHKFMPGASATPAPVKGKKHNQPKQPERGSVFDNFSAAHAGGERRGLDRIGAQPRKGLG